MTYAQATRAFGVLTQGRAASNPADPMMCCPGARHPEAPEKRTETQTG